MDLVRDNYPIFNYKMRPITRIELLSRKYIPKQCPVQLQLEAVIRGVKFAAEEGETMYIDIPFPYEAWEIVDKTVINLVDIFPDSLVYTLHNASNTEKAIVIDWT